MTAMPRKAPFLLVAVLVALVGAAVLGFSLTRGHGEQAFMDSVVFVPVVVGKSERAATAAIARAGLRPEVRYRRMRAANRGMTRFVIAQSPAARITSRGKPVRLVVAIATPDTAERPE